MSQKTGSSGSYTLVLKLKHEDRKLLTELKELEGDSMSAVLRRALRSRHKELMRQAELEGTRPQAIAS